MARSVVSLMIAMIVVMGASLPARQGEMFNYGRQWNAWSEQNRWIYLTGFIEGQSDTFSTMMTEIPAGRREPLRLRLFTFYGEEAIAKVMTSLYADPANTFIRHGAMVYIARDKLNGQDVEPALRHSRATDRGYTK